MWDAFIGFRTKGIATADNTAAGMIAITTPVNAVDVYPSEPNSVNEKQAHVVLAFR